MCASQAVFPFFENNIKKPTLLKGVLGIILVFNYPYQRFFSSTTGAETNRVAARIKLRTHIVLASDIMRSGIIDRGASLAFGREIWMLMLDAYCLDHLP